MTEPDFLHTARTFYDTVAADYAEHFRDELGNKPLDRALFTGFAELVRSAGDGPVVDVGCGPGGVTAHLHALGLTVSGIDLSARMLAVARRAHPHLRFDEGSMTALDLPDGALGGVVANYSIIHIPQERLPEMFAEFERVLAPGGHVLLVFQVGDEPLHLTEPWGHAVSLDFHRLEPDSIAGLVAQAGLVVHAQMLREPAADGAERTPQGYVLGRKPLDADRSGVT